MFGAELRRTKSYPSAVLLDLSGVLLLQLAVLAVQSLQAATKYRNYARF